MLVSLGVDYQRASLAILDAVTLRDQTGFYQILGKIPRVKGSIILQTCNRVDFYLDTEAGPVVVDDVLWHWALETRFKLGDLKRLVGTKEEDEVIEYLVRLGAGLESMLVGESQVLGQMKAALAEARSLRTATPILSMVFDKAISASAQIREQTGIGKGTVSLGSAALRLAEEKLGSLVARHVLLIGTGQVGMLMMKALKARGISRVAVASRTRERAESFTQAHGGNPIRLEDVQAQLSRCDLVITATKAGSYLVTKEMVASALEGAGKPEMLLDLSSPRNISPDTAELKGVDVRTIEDIRGIADEALARRRELVKTVEALVMPKVENIIAAVRRENAEPVVSDIYKQADEVRAVELNKALSKLKLAPDQEEILKNMSQSIIEKLLEPPIKKLRRAAERGDSQTLAVAGQLFSGDR